MLLSQIKDNVISKTRQESPVAQTLVALVHMDILPCDEICLPVAPARPSPAASSWVRSALNWAGFLMLSDLHLYLQGQTRCDSDAQISCLWDKVPLEGHQPPLWGSSCISNGDALELCNHTHSCSWSYRSRWDGPNGPQPGSTHVGLGVPAHAVGRHPPAQPATRY